MINIFCRHIKPIDHVEFTYIALCTSKRGIDANHHRMLCVICRVAAANGKNRSTSIAIFYRSGKFIQQVVCRISASISTKVDVTIGIRNLVSRPVNECPIRVFCNVGNADHRIGNATIAAISLGTVLVQGPNEDGPHVLPTVRKAIKPTAAIKVSGIDGIGTDDGRHHTFVV